MATARRTRRILTWKDLTGSVRGGSAQNRGYKVVRTKRYRNWLLHRAVADMMVKEWNPFGWTELPPDIQVHHMDSKRSHCCPQNLLLLPLDFHTSFDSRNLRCPYTGRFLSRREWEILNGSV